MLNYNSNMKKLALLLLLISNLSAYTDDTPVKETAASITVERLQSTDCESKDITEELEDIWRRDLVTWFKEVNHIKR